MAEFSYTLVEKEGQSIGYSISLSDAYEKKKKEDDR